ncbi:DegQ family serine endoprotease [Endothiovibrio diazotrophicus]
MSRLSRLVRPLVAALFIAASPIVSAALPLAVDGEPLPTLAPMLERITPAVVNIATYTRVRVSNPLMEDPFFRRFFSLPAPQERRSRAAGSGVVVDAERGYIVTNHHVVDNAEEVVVTLRDGRTLDAQVVGSDPETDVAVIQVPAEHLTAIPMADSDKLRVGDFVVAIGNPFALGQTVTSGIVSALGRSGLGIEGYEDFIQTDASINPGNSGGALVNLRGELTGINTAILSKSGGNVGIGFAIPTNMVRQVLDQLVSHGRVERGRLGITAQDLTPELAAAFGIDERGGAVVAQVTPDSPAANAGVQVGDVIVSVNGHAVRDAAGVRNAVGLLRVGSEVEMKALRSGQRLTLKAKVENVARDTLEGERLDPRLAGALFKLMGEPGNDHGVAIARIEPGSPAARAGLRRGDLIASVNRRPITSIEELEAAVGNGNGPLLLNIHRGREAQFLLLR